MKISESKAAVIMKNNQPGVLAAKTLNKSLLNKLLHNIRQLKTSDIFCALTALPATTQPTANHQTTKDNADISRISTVNTFLHNSGIFAAALLITMFLLSGTMAIATDYYSIANGNWSNANGTVWSLTDQGGPVGANVHPGVGDVVYITRGFTVTVDVTDAACKSLTLGKIGGSNAGKGTLQFASSGSPSLTVSGSVVIGGTSTTNGSTGTITFSNGSRMSAGSLQLGGSNGGNTGTITMSAGGGLVVGGSITIGSDAGTWTPGTTGTGTVIMTAINTLPATIFTTFNNLIVSGGTTTLGVSLAINGTLTQSGSNIAVGSKTLTVNAIHDGGTNTVSGTGGYILAATGTLITANTGGINGTITTTTKTLNVAADYTFDGTANQNIGSYFPTNLTGILTINNPGFTVTLDAARTIANLGVINLTAGTFATGTNLTMASTSTINRSEGSMTGTPAGAGAYDVTYTGDTKTTGTELSGSGLRNVTVNLTSGQTLTLDANRVPDGNLTVSSGIFDLNAYTINRSGGGGTFSMAAGTTMLLGGSNFPGSYTTNTLNATSTVNYDAAGAQNITAVVYGNMTLSVSGVKTIPTGTTVTGNFLMEGSATATPAATFAVSGSTTLSGTSVLTLGATNILSSTPVVLNGGTFRTGASAGFSEAVGTLDVDANSTIALGTGSHTLAFANSSAVAWAGTTLTITGWTGNAGSSGTAGKIVVGSGGLSQAQLAKVSFSGYTAGAQILGTGELVPVVPVLAITGTTIHGSICVGTPATSIQYTITNTGGAATGVSVGSNKAQFVVSGLSSTTIAGSGGTATYNVTFTPSGIGAQSATITVSSTTSGSNTPTSSLTGTGLNTSPTISTPTSAAITATTATLGGNITALGCTNVTERGIYWSTTNLFADGAGTKVSATPGPYTTGVFTIPVTGLSPNTPIYYKAFATNSGGVAYSALGTFTSATPTIAVGTVTDFGYQAINTISAEKSYTITGTNLIADVVLTPPDGFKISTTSGSGYDTGAINLTPTSGSVNQTIYMVFNPTATQAYSGSITHTSTSASSQNVVVTGTSTVPAGACIFANNTADDLVVIPCINMPSNVMAVSTAIDTKKYFVMNVIEGLTYQVYTTENPTTPLKFTVYNESTQAFVAYSASNTGNPTSVDADDVYLSFTSDFSGQVRVLINHRTDCASTAYTNINTNVNVTGGSNTQDSQTTAGTNTWTGHIYDGTNAANLYNGDFANYLGYYTQTENFNEIFGDATDTYCFGPVTSNGTPRANVQNGTFSVRYRMNSTTRKGLYTAAVGSDDGSRLAVDNNLIYNIWADQAYANNPGVLMNLTGNSSLVLDFYENGGGNQASFQTLTLVLANYLANNTTQNVCLGNPGSAISGDTYGTLPTGITLSGTGYQWAWSTSSSGPWTDISGATAATYTPSSASAPFNSAGTYYIIRKAKLLSASNNIGVTNYIATNESNAATLTVNTLAPTITTASTPALVATVCQSAVNQNTIMEYSATSGSPTSYSIDWITTGIADQGSTAFAFAADGGTMNNIVIPAGAVGNTYDGIMTITNAGGCNATQTVTVTVNPPPSAAGTISGTSSICQGATGVAYSVGAITNATSYTWAYSGTGATIVGTTNNITINFSGSATGGNLTVKGTNSCGNGTVSANYAITMKPQPSAVTIAPASASICNGSILQLTASGGQYASTLTTTPLTELFNSTTTVFTVSGTEASATQNSTYYSEGSNSWLFKESSHDQTGNYSETDPIDLSVYTSATLTFSHICATEKSYDYGYVEYSTDGGTSYTTFPTNSYSGSGTLKNTVVSFDASSYTEWNSNFTSYASLPTNSLWKTETINIPNTALTANFKIQFRINTDYSIIYYGWLIDNLKITAVSASTGSSFTWTPITGLYANAGATTSYTGTVTPTVYAKPSSTTTYSATSTSPEGCTSSANVAVTVNALPVAGAIIGGNAVCIGNTLVLSSNATGTGTLTYSWASSDITKATVSSTGVVSPVAAGSTNITYTVTDGSSTFCTATSASFAVTLNALPTTTYSVGGGGVYCAGGVGVSITLSGSQTDVTYELWKDGTATGTTKIGNNSALTFTGVTDAGNYTIKGTNGNNCISTMPGNATVTLNPTPTATAPDNQTYTSGVATSEIPLSGTPDGVIFDITGGTSVGLENQTGVTSVPSFTPTSGTATITVTPRSAAGCTGAGVTYTITIISTPTVTAPANQSYCAGVATTALTLTGTPSGFVFDITGGSSVGLDEQTGLTAIPSFTPIEGTATVIITPKANGFTGTPVSYGITVNPLPTVSAGSPFTKTCTSNLTGAVIGETTESGCTYSWSPATGLSSATVSNPFANPSTTTTYTVTKTNSATGCSTQATVVVTVDNTPPTVATITGTTSVCTGSTTTLSSTTAGGLWSTGNGAIATVANGVVTGVSGGTTNISYTVTGSNGCTTVVSSSVTVKALPSVDAITSQAVCSGSSTTAVTLASTPGGSTFAWTSSATAGITGQTAGGTGNIPVETLSTSAAVAGTITYTITPTLNGCQGSAGTFTVTVNPLPTLIVNTNLYGCVSADLSNAITSSTGTITYPSGQIINSNGGYTIRATIGSCWIEKTVVVTINPLPTVTIGTINNICEGSTAFAIPFTVTNGANQYTLSGTGIVPMTLQALGDSPIAANLTSTSSGTRTFALTVRNSTTGCTSAEVTGSVTAIPAPDFLDDPCFYSCSGIATGITLPAKDDYDLPLTSYTIYDAGNSDEQTQPNKTISGTFTGEDAINAIKNDILINESADQIYVSYEVIPYAGDCAGASFYIDVIVNPLPSAPTGAASQSFCSGNPPTVANLAATGTDIGNAIQWYAVSSGGTALATSTPLVNGTHYFASQSTTCESTARLDVTVIINATPVLTGLTTSASSVCAGDPSVVTIGATSLPNGSYTVNYTLTGANAHTAINVTMTVTGGNSGTFNITSLSGSGTTTLTINSLMLNGCATNATTGNSTTITVTAPGTWLGTISTSWNNVSNWCGGVPTLSTNVVIPSGTTYQPLVDMTTAVCNSLTINTDAILTIGAGQALTVLGTLTNNGGTAGLLLQSSVLGTASLIQSTLGVPVPATVSRYMSGAAESWHFLSSPVAEQDINENRGLSTSWMPYGTFGNHTGYDLYVWDEPSNCWKFRLDTTSIALVKNWTSATVHPQSYFVPGRGYLYSVQAITPTKVFTGNLNNGTVNYPLTNLGNSLSIPSLNGFNLVGNPYPSSIDWKAASGWTRTNLKLSLTGYDMWIYNPSAGNYGVFNSASSTGTNEVTQYIAPMQGFFVRAASEGNLVMNNTIREHWGASEWKSATIDPNQFSVVVKSAADNTGDEARLLFGYHENQPGAAKLFSPVTTAPSLYLPAGGLNYTVRYLTDTIDNPVVPVMFKPGVNGTYTLQCNFETAQFETVLLEDLKTQNIQDLKISPAYQFSATVSDVVNRFALHFAPISTTSLKELPGKITTDGLHINIDLTFVSGPTEVTVYDVLGRKLYEQQVPGETITTLNFSAGRQLLLVKLQNPQGSLCRKIIGSNK